MRRHYLSVVQALRLFLLCSLLIISAAPPGLADSAQDSLLRRGRAVLQKESPSRAELLKLIPIISTLRLALPDTGLGWAEALEKRAVKARQPDIEITALYIQAAANILRSRYLLGEKLYAQGQAKAARLGNDSLEAQGMAGVGSARAQAGNVEDAASIQFKALKLRQRIGDREGEASSLVNLGRLYYNMQRLDESERFLDRALAIYGNQPPAEDRSYLNALHTKANIAGQSGRFEEALRLDSIGLDRCRRSNNLAQQTIFLDNIANCYAAQKRWAEAEDYFHRCFAIDSSFQNWKDVGDTWSNLGLVSEMQGKDAEALQRYRAALRYAIRGSDPAGAQKVYMRIAPLYRRLGQSDSAFAAMQQAYSLRDSVLGERSRAKLDELSALYETEQKERRIAEQSFALKQRNYLLAGAGALLLVAAAGAVSYNRRQRLRHRLRTERVLTQQREEATRAIIVAEEEERSRLGRELHDGVGQIISAAKMHLTGLNGGELPPAAHDRVHTAIELVDNAASELRALSHGMAPEPLLGAGLAHAAQDMLRKMQTGTLRMEFHADELPPLPHDTTVVLYRILQEATQNAIRHGAAKHIAVTLNRDADHLTVLIEDDGSGFDTAATSPGIGLANMRKRAEYLKGTLEIDSAPGRGTTLAVHVPI